MPYPLITRERHITLTLLFALSLRERAGVRA